MGPATIYRTTTLAAHVRYGFFLDFFFTNRLLKNRSVGPKNEGFHAERVLSVCTGSADKI
jgi:hypothetical protein